MNRKLFYGLSCLMLFVFHRSFSQNTEIILFQMSEKDTALILKNPINISLNKGYDNQPFFTEDGKRLLYTSKRDSTPTEIYEYDLTTKKTKRLTKNKENEYSPKLEGAEQRLTVVKGPEQRLIKYKEDFITEDTILVLRDSIGYYEKISQKEYLIYALSNPHSLNLVDTSNVYEMQLLTERPGRCFYRFDDKGFIYMEKGKTQTEPNMLYWNHKGKNYKVDEMPAGSEFYCIWESNLYAVWNNKLWECRLMEDRKWKEKADLSSFKFEEISRIAIHPNKNLLALAVKETEEILKLGLKQNGNISNTKSNTKNTK